MENLRFKGTKGKWTYDEKTKSFLDENKNNVPMPDNFCSTRPEAEVFGKDKYWNEAQANAKLIASAPELLEISKKARTALNMLLHPNDMNNIEFELKARLLAKDVVEELNRIIEKSIK